jgi:hypothetical protein
MTRLRKRMMEELQLRNLSPVTADTQIMHGAARLTAEPTSRSYSSLTDRLILR